MKKKIISILSIISIGGLIWYLFIKPYDYLVRFKTNTNVGVINQALKAWSNSYTDSKIQFSDNLNMLSQQIDLGEDTYTYEWIIEPTTDSTSFVKAYATDTKNSLINKLKIPFTETTIEKKVKENISEFNTYLIEHLKNFKVGTVVQEKLPSKYVAYVSIKTTQNKKVGGMMKNHPYLDNIMATNKIKPDGLPFIEVTYWNTKNDSIYYDFCYPIIKEDRLPYFKDIKYRRFEGGNMLKTEYNGNYITSDRAWYKLMNTAKSKNISVKKLPIEVFYTNPNFGGNELEWKAEIFMPIIIK
ncbi:GyrI-like domain-containing protein [Cellulophaga sp. E16_2]|uniref:GyrI-like domain-containing protein n=1 Tax=unclassified Cellulophaga TaxID=2634405 RepID=UPI0013FE0801|nr:MULTISPECIES: GyrI-like domain-containing protein [unclassified Cellulophaga]MBO0590732.1 GyrI-like domain-containing protein [Cellulophaga sp. E16_2]